MRVATQYVKLVKDLDKEYEQEIYNKWTSHNSTRALQDLEKYILKEEKKGPTPVYKVNFAPELRVTIREAKFLDRIG
jgi:hypothetical protein